MGGQIPSKNYYQATQNNMCVLGQFFFEKVRVSAKTKHKSEKIHRIFFIEERCKISFRLQFICIQMILNCG